MTDRLVRGACIAAALALTACEPPGPPTIDYEVAAVLPHDPEAYTQGLVYHDRRVFESVGQYGSSALREVDPETGRVLREVAVDSAYFAEGLARVGSELIQLTWKSEVAFVYDLESFELLRSHSYAGEGWGLCFDGESLFMSNGTSTLSVRDPETFEETGTLRVVSDGLPVPQLNELECVGPHIYANLYLTDRIVRIDRATGEIDGEIDGSELEILGRRPPGQEAVLNGLAWIPETEIMLATGKLWPKMLALRLRDAGGVRR